MISKFNKEILKRQESVILTHSWVLKNVPRLKRARKENHSHDQLVKKKKKDKMTG